MRPASAAEMLTRGGAEKRSDLVSAVRRGARRKNGGCGGKKRRIKIFRFKKLARSKDSPSARERRRD